MFFYCVLRPFKKFSGLIGVFILKLYQVKKQGALNCEIKGGLIGLYLGRYYVFCIYPYFAF